MTSLPGGDRPGPGHRRRGRVRRGSPCGGHLRGRLACHRPAIQAWATGNRTGDMCRSVARASYDRYGSLIEPLCGPDISGAPYRQRANNGREPCRGPSARARGIDARLHSHSLSGKRRRSASSCACRRRATGDVPGAGGRLIPILSPHLEYDDLRETVSSLAGRRPPLCWTARSASRPWLLIAEAGRGP